MRKKNYISTVGMSDAEWLALRQYSIGASEVAAAMEACKYKSRFMLWEEKALGVKRDFNESALHRMDMGNRLEDVICKLASDRLGLPVFEDNKIRIHPEHEFMTCNLDRRIYDPTRGPGALEAKSTSKYVVDSWEPGQDMELSWFLQIQDQLAITGWKWGYVAILIDGRDFRLIPVQRDEKVIKNITLACVRFWSLVRNGTPPQERDLDIPYMRPNPGISVIASSETEARVIEIAKLNSKIKSLEAEKEALKKKIQLFMNDQNKGDHLYSASGELIATWKLGKKNRSFRLC